MSYRHCEYCLRPEFKTNGKAESICENRAMYGNCEGRKGEPVTVQKLPGRNEKCGCGSGKKFKHCCLNIIVPMGL